MIFPISLFFAIGVKATEIKLVFRMQHFCYKKRKKRRGRGLPIVYMRLHVVIIVSSTLKLGSANRASSLRAVYGRLYSSMDGSFRPNKHLTKSLRRCFQTRSPIFFKSCGFFELPTELSFFLSDRAWCSRFDPSYFVAQRWQTGVFCLVGIFPQLVNVLRVHASGIHITCRRLFFFFNFFLSLNWLRG